MTGLSVRGFTSATRIHLPPAYTRGVIPVDRSHIPKKMESSHKYAQRTDLGWSIVGRATPRVNLEDVTGLSHRIATKELPAVTPSDAIRMLELDFGDINHTDKCTSQDDRLFIQKLEEIRQKEDGHIHYEVPLPFKNRPQLHNNKKLARIRLEHLKRNCDKD